MEHSFNQGKYRSSSANRAEFDSCKLKRRDWDPVYVAEDWSKLFHLDNRDRGDLRQAFPRKLDGGPLRYQDAWTPVLLSRKKKKEKENIISLISDRVF